MRHRNRNKLGTGGPEIDLADPGHSGSGLSEFSRKAAFGMGDHPRRPRKFGRIVPKMPRSRNPTTPIGLIDLHTKRLEKLRAKLEMATNAEQQKKIHRNIEVKSDYIARLHTELLESRS